VNAAAATALANWPTAIRRYLLVSAIGHLAWEVVQLPLYTLWRSGSPDLIAGAVLHCWLGDLVIASVALLAALAIAGDVRWPARRVAMVCSVVITVSVGYTAYSEYLNAVVRHRWSYADIMPTVGGIGLSPLAQWVVVPVVALTRASRRPVA
jgi:hypothetical protein